MMPPAPWEIRHVDLLYGVPDLDVVQAKAARFILRLDNVVLGAVNLLPDELPMSAAEFAGLAAEAMGDAAARLLAYGAEDEACGRLPAAAARRATYQPSFLMPGDAAIPALRRVIAARREYADKCSVSIVICTRHRPAQLAACLTACAPELAKGREIIVVDNGPDEATRSLVAGMTGAHYVEEARPGLSRARNAGIRASTGDVVAFIDDDVRPELGWVDALLIPLADPKTSIATGLVLPADLTHDAQVTFEFGLGFGGMGFVPLRYDADYLHAHQNRGAPVWTIGAGANMAVRRVLFSEIGLFDEDLGAGTSAPCSEDSEFWYRALAAGHTIKYEPFSVVRHVHRSDLEDLRTQARGYKNGHVAALFVQFRKHGHWGNLRRALFGMPISYALQCLLRTMISRSSHADLLFWYGLQGYMSGLRHFKLAFKYENRRKAPNLVARPRQRSKALPDPHRWL